MVMSNIFGVLFLTVVGFIIWFALSLGYFNDVPIHQSKMGPIVLAYKDHVGPYHFISKSIIEVERWAHLEKLDCTKSFGEYLDQPDKVEHERLRSRGGCVLNEKPNLKAPSDLQIIERPETDYVVAEFGGSPALGPYKVYNKVDEYFSKNNLQHAGAVIEIYEMSNDRRMTTYLFPYTTSVQ